VCRIGSSAIMTMSDCVHHLRRPFTITDLSARTFNIVRVHVIANDLKAEARERFRWRAVNIMCERYGAPPVVLASHARLHPGTIGGVTPQ
jgi:hypothetical protein